MTEQADANTEVKVQNQLLRQIAVYTKLANYDSIKNRLLAVLNSDGKRKVFEASDGQKSVRDIEAETGVGKDTVSNWWKEWESEGIVEETEEARGRRRKVLSLGDFGIGSSTGKEKPKSTEPKKPVKTEDTK